MLELYSLVLCNWPISHFQPNLCNGRLQFMGTVMVPATMSKRDGLATTMSRFLVSLGPTRYRWYTSRTSGVCVIDLTKLQSMGVFVFPSNDDRLDTSR